MNAWQALKQLKLLLQQAAWTDSPSDAVFGKVLISSAIPVDAIDRIILPMVQIFPGEGEADPEEEDLWSSTFEVMVVARVEGDAFGESVLIGNGRGASGAGSSQGRGLMELEEIIFATIGALNGTDGIDLRVDARTGAKATEDPELGYVATISYRVQAWVTTSRSYPAPTRLAGVDDGTGGIDLTWTLPTSRYDRTSLVLRRASGSTAPTSVTDGTGVTVGALVALVSDTGLNPGGTYSYSLFMGYDDLGTGTVDRYSAAETVTVLMTSPVTIMGDQVAAWFDAADSSSITSDANGISSWADQISGNTAAVQSDNAKKPNLAAASIGGRDAVLFVAGNSEHLQTTALSVTAAPFRIFCILELTDLLANYMIATLNGGAFGGNYAGPRVASTSGFAQFLVYDGGLALASTTPAGVAGGVPFLITCIEAAVADRTVELDGGDAGTDSTSTTPTGLDALTLGGNGNVGLLTGMIGEFVLVDETLGVMSAGEIAAMETYLGDKWGVTIA